MNTEIVKTVVGLYRQGQKAVLVTLCSTSGSTPRKAGAKMLVFPRGNILGSIGGGALELAAEKKALELMKTGEPALLWERDLADEGMVCGGAGVLYFEVIDGSEAR